MRRVRTTLPGKGLYVAQLNGRSVLFDIYGRFSILIERSGDTWIAYRQTNGVRRRDADIVFPPGLTEDELATYLDDLFHEYASPGASIREVRG